MVPVFNKSESTPRRQCRIGLAGPCGVGKSTLAALLARAGRSIGVVREMEAPCEIDVMTAPSATSVEHYQRSLNTFRREQAVFKHDMRFLLFDRTPEEDREVFLPLYNRLGFINSSLLNLLTQLSLDAEMSVSPIDGTIFLTAPRDVLRHRLAQAQQQRPHWLVQHAGLQCDLYDDWIARKREPVLVLDTSAFDMAALCSTAMQYIETVESGMQSAGSAQLTSAAGTIAS